MARPVDIAWRDLRLSHESDPAVTEIGKADRIPRGDFIRRAPVEFGGDVVRHRCHHALDHEAGFGDSYRHRGWPHGRDGDADTERIDVLEGWIALVLVGQNEPARVSQAFDAIDRLDASECGQDHRIAKGQIVGLLDRAVLGHFLDMHHGLIDAGDARIGYPFDVAVAHFALEQAFGVAHAVKTEVADIGFGGDKGHWHLVADFTAAQFGVED